MADIQTLLNNISKAVFGKDVRQSIHDAIQQCYYDGKAGAIDLEARQLLETKADKTDISTPYNFKGSVTFAELPASGNSVNDTYYVTDQKCKYTWDGAAWYQSSMNESDYQEELSQLSGDLTQLDTRLSESIISSPNLFDIGRAKNGYYENVVSGQPQYVENSEFFCAIIPVDSDTDYCVTSESYYTVLYDMNLNKIKSFGNGNTDNIPHTYHTTVDTKFISVSVKYYRAEKYMIVKGDVLPNEYIPFYKKLYKSGYVTADECKKIVKPKEYHIYSDGTGDYTNITDCLKALQNDVSEKIIFVHGGIYNIFEEYGGTQYANTVISNDEKFAVWLPNNTSIIGIGKVVLNYMPTADETTVFASQCISPINIKGTATLENLEIYARNCRYCIHDESNGNDVYNGSKKVYKNVKCVHYADDDGYGFGGQAYACGFDKNFKFNFYNCMFESKYYPFSMHDRAGNTPESSIINIDSCQFISDEGSASLRFGNVNMHQMHHKVNINNSYITAPKGNRYGILIKEETNGSGVPNSFDLTLIGCTCVNPSITTQNNIYDVKQYNPIGNVMK